MERALERKAYQKSLTLGRLKRAKTGHDEKQFITGVKIVYLFELMLYIPVNSNSHVGMLPPFYWSFTKY